jgi:hypothetical protein
MYLRAPASPVKSSWTASSAPRKTPSPEVRGLKGPPAHQRALWHCLGAGAGRRPLVPRPPVRAGPQAPGKPLAANQLIQKKLAGHADRSRSACNRRLRLGRMKDEGTASVEITSILKRKYCGSQSWTRTARDMLRQRDLRRIRRAPPGEPEVSTPTKARTMCTR